MLQAIHGAAAPTGINQNLAMFSLYDIEFPVALAAI